MVLRGRTEQEQRRDIDSWTVHCNIMYNKMWCETCILWSHLRRLGGVVLSNNDDGVEHCDAFCSQHSRAFMHAQSVSRPSRLCSSS